MMKFDDVPYPIVVIGKSITFSSSLHVTRMNHLDSVALTFSLSDAEPQFLCSSPLAKNATSKDQQKQRPIKQPNQYSFAH